MKFTEKKLAIDALIHIFMLLCSKAITKLVAAWASQITNKVNVFTRNQTAQQIAILGLFPHIAYRGYCARLFIEWHKMFSSTLIYWRTLAKMSTQNCKAQIIIEILSK